MSVGAQRCAQFEDVVVATCDHEIADTVARAGGHVILTSVENRTGADRVAEALQQLDCTHVVLVQGDEPLALPEHLELMVEAVKREPACGAWNAVGPLEPSDWETRSVVKCLLSASGRIMALFRDPAWGPGARVTDLCWRKVLGLMAFRRETLSRFAALESRPYEQVVSIEQCRLLEYDIELLSVPLPGAYPGVNEPGDLTHVERVLQQDPRQQTVGSQITSGAR
jgi:3-deoxy-manno-octulosonate cytidylyltransferase (CMP-KDO synthetase)